MRKELSKKESARVMKLAADMRPTENVHADPALADPSEAAGDELTEEESAAIHRFATDVRPTENFHPKSSKKD